MTFYVCQPNIFIDLQHPISSGHVEFSELTVPPMSESGNWHQKLPTFLGEVGESKSKQVDILHQQINFASNLMG